MPVRFRDCFNQFFYLLITVPGCSYESNLTTIIKHNNCYYIIVVCIVDCCFIDCVISTAHGWIVQMGKCCLSCLVCHTEFGHTYDKFRMPRFHVMS
uniref:Uncharacterized protein n=1 Tax=Oryza brachyantha TaxID=4533 RepID=J3M547_ORYBR